MQASELNAKGMGRGAAGVAPYVGTWWMLVSCFFKGVVFHSDSAPSHKRTAMICWIFDFQQMKLYV